MNKKEPSKYIEQGWQSYRKLLVDSGAGEVQIKETRQAFFAGAAVLFHSIMQGLDPGEEETDNDMQRMTDIANELTEFGQKLDAKYFGAMPPIPRVMM